MSSKNHYENLWAILRENNFTFNELEHADYICIICKKLLIEAKQAPCACKFCSKCIEEYLSKGNSICPGNTSECNEEILQINENTSNDYATNRKISKLKLKCPTDNCTYEDILLNMNQHLMLCGKPSVVCPFSQFGCNQVCNDKGEIANHLQLENYEHAQLLMEMIVNLKNEVGILQKENILLKSDSDKQQKLIETLKLEINEVRECCANITNSESYLNSEDYYLDWFQNEEVSEDSSESNETDDMQLKCKEFSWIISDFARKQLLKSFDSRAFYTHPNGYRLQLRLLPTSLRSAGWYGVSIYPNCVTGKFDECLEWPLVCEITIGIIDQRTGVYLNKITRQISYDNSYKSYVSPFDFPLNDNLSLFKNSLKVECTLQIIE